MTIPVLSSEDYLRNMLAVPRACAPDILAFYEHRVGAVCTDPAVMLIPLDDHVTHRGDGVFETLKYMDGRLYLLDPHMERLRRSATGLFLEAPCPWSHIREVILAVAAAGGEPSGHICVILSRGPGGFGLDPSQCPVSGLYVVAYRFHAKPESWFEKGLKGFRTTIPAKQPHMAKIKNTNYMSNMLMLREARERGADIPFCFDDDEHLAESAAANLCIVDASGTLSVPEFTHSLPGTTLIRALDLLEGVVPVTFRPITEKEIFSAKEAILFGTGPDCIAITSYEGKAIADGSPGPVSRKARELIARDIRDTGTTIPGFGKTQTSL